MHEALTFRSSALPLARRKAGVSERACFRGSDRRTHRGEQSKLVSSHLWAFMLKESTRWRPRKK